MNKDITPEQKIINCRNTTSCIKISTLLKKKNMRIYAHKLMAYWF